MEKIDKNKVAVVAVLLSCTVLALMAVTFFIISKDDGSITATDQNETITVPVGPESNTIQQATTAPVASTDGNKKSETSAESTDTKTSDTKEVAKI